MNLKDLQKSLKPVETFLITHDNMFMAQDMQDSENPIEALTGFKGSAGILLVSPKKAWLLVDGRYVIQAKLQTNSKEITVVESKNFRADVIEICLKNKMKTLSFNPWCVSVSDAEIYAEIFKIKPCADVLPSNVTPPSEVLSLPIKYAGQSAEKKCQQAAKAFPEGVDAQLICAADEVSWLLNLRTKCLPFTPVLRAFALLDKKAKVQLFAENCQKFGIKPLKDLLKALSKFHKKTVLFDPSITPYAVLNAVPQDVTFKRGESPIAQIKASKNKTELKGFVDSHLADAVAVSKFLCWLSENYKGKTELDIVQKLHDFRVENPLFVSESFATIAAFGAHGAIVHYQPSEKTNVSLQGNSLLLIDSGGQYLNGTTDVTRTIAIGKPTEQMKDDFTYVLKAHLKLTTAIFPEGTTGAALDSICRGQMWQKGMEYRHGTGHGVGHFLNVHEGPFGMKPNATRARIGLGYVTSVEPGYYIENKYGIRIENMVCALAAKYKGFLCFENLTLIPIDKTLINPYLLSVGERDALNNYHQRVWRCLAPYMENHEAKWLKAACSPL